jgi:hypothetical protein
MTHRMLACRAQVNACVGFRDDAAGVKGMFVDPDVLKTAVVAAISATLARLAPSVLPLRELVRGLTRNLPYCALAPGSTSAVQARWSSGWLVEAARCLHRSWAWWRAPLAACARLRVHANANATHAHGKVCINLRHECTLA